MKYVTSKVKMAFLHFMVVHQLMKCLVAFIFLDSLVGLVVFWSGEQSINKCFLVLLLMKPLSTSNISTIPYKMKSGSHDNRCDAISMGEDCIKILLDYNITKTSPYHHTVILSDQTLKKNWDLSSFAF